MGYDDLASVNARKECMGNVTVSVSQKSLSRGCTVFIENAWIVLPSVILPALHASQRANYSGPGK